MPPTPTPITDPAGPSAGTAPVGADQPGRLPSWWPWGMGFLLGLVVLGPGLAGGSLLSLDLLVTPDIPIPNGVFGLGPALSQRVPLFAVLGVASAVVGGPVAVKVFLVATVTVGFAGAARLVRLVSPGVAFGVIGPLAAGLLWAGGPFALTRIAAGHINLLWVVAVLPWALPRLCRPADDLPSTFLASLLLAVGGPGGGTLGLAVGFISLVVQARRGRVLVPGAVLLAPQAIWLAPTAVLLWAGAGVTGAGGFETWVDGSSSWAAVPAGNGFWRWDVQVGAAGWAGALAGLVVLGLATVGATDVVARRGIRSWPGSATVVAAVGLVLALASSVPGVRDGYAWASDLPVGAPLRESHRFLALWLVWAAPMMVVGSTVLARRLASGARSGTGRAVRAVPLVVAAALSVPGWWGLEGRLEPVDYPAGWGAARAVLADAPGTVVALPWSEYPPLSFAGDRQVFNPLPEYLGGDVISSYDPVFDPDRPAQEQVDRRADVVDRLAADARDGIPIGPALGDLGVRWVVVAHESNWEDYAVLLSDPALRPALTLADLDLYEVTTWPGPISGDAGDADRLDRPLPPLILTDGGEGAVLNVAGAPGWIQGLASPAQVTEDGRLRLTGDGSVVWFWPAPVLVIIDLLVFLGALKAVHLRRNRFGRILALGPTRG